MTKADLVSVITEKIGFTSNDSFKLIELLFEAMKTALASGEQVKISGFGTWTVKEKDPRKGRNPQTGQDILLDGRKVMVFKTSAVMKARINKGTKTISSE